jgi:hypothetical protein
MSRRQPQHYTEVQPPIGDYEDDQVISATGDEIMDDAQGEEEEGYSE